jgi:plastocyanin
VVHRRLSRLALAVLAAAALVAVLAAPASAANRRIAIGHYHWSSPEVDIDLGEHVTWYWVGPDTMHSVTGTSANDAGLDSDPGNDVPRHRIGDSFQLTFNEPGTYTFQCKLHSVVRGTIVVAPTPGDPATEVDPIPRSHVDLRAPRLDGVRVVSPPRRSDRARLRFALDERASVDAELYRLGGGHRRFAGFEKWGGHIGFNDVPLGRHARHFRPRRGRYLAVLRATDAANNTSRPRRLRFRLGGR